MLAARALVLSILVCGAALADSAHAAQPPEALRSRGLAHGGLELADGRVVSRRAPAAWDAGTRDARRQAATARVEASVGRAFVAWDEATGLPRRILTLGTPAPDATADPDAAAAIARALLAEHVDLLAPGASADDFVIVTNDLSGGIRSIGLLQTHRGRLVLGGQVSFRFAHDRLVEIASEAAPWVDADVAPAYRDDAGAREDARAWIVADVPGRVRSVGAVDGPFVLPIADGARPRHREVLRVVVDVEAPASRWSVYVDAQTGEPVAREQTLTFASGTLLYDAPLRGPASGPRIAYPAAGAAVIVDGGGQITPGTGLVEFAAATALVATAVSGPDRHVDNVGGPPATQNLFIGDGGSVTWSAATDELVDAQISAFVHAGIVKAHVRAIDPSLAFLDADLPITVNIEDQCNAFSDGFSINFYRASESCENTARLSDVVYHEFGHSVHHQSLLAGVGSFDVALSEGISDYLSATITGDPGVARGFFYDDTPLRDLDPDGFEWRWPDDFSEVHLTGRIIGGALWDLRTLLIAKYGPSGRDVTDRLWYEATRRAVDIPSMYPEVLLADDDDGTLANGTPNGCEINAAFAAHGLLGGGGAFERVTIEPVPEGFRVDLAQSLPMFSACPIDGKAVLVYRLRDEPNTEVTVDMPPSGGVLSATMPADALGQVLQYRVIVEQSGGTVRSLPENLADPWYEVFVGAVQPIYCTSFGDTFEWVLDGGFEIGPLGATSAVDPATDVDGDGVVLGSVLLGQGLYGIGASDRAGSPAIAVDPGAFDSVRLQYQRWLTVEDAFFDRASITVDGDVMWANYGSDDEYFASVHHRDLEWRFQDVDITEHVQDGSVELGFSLDSDFGLSLGGWNVDSLCVVGWSATATGCGNGVLDPGEACDDGNVVDGDGCSTACTIEPDGGTTGPSGGSSDDGSDGDDESGSDDGSDDGTGSDGGDPSLDGEGGLVGRGCACTTDRDPALAGAPALLAFLALGRRRRTRAARTAAARRG